MNWPHGYFKVFLSIATAMLFASTTTGCAMLTEDPYAPTSAEDTARAAEVLVELPSLEAVESTLTAAIEEIAAGATALDPALHWEWSRERNRGGCWPPYDQTDGRLTYLPSLVTDSVRIADEHWPRIFELTRDVAAKIGATKVQTLQNSSAHHDVRFYDETGLSVRIGSKIAATITGDTGCRLPQAEKAQR